MFCYDQQMFVARNMCFSRQKKQQKYVCRDEYLSPQTRISRDKRFVWTRILLSRQKTYFVATNSVCCDKFCLLRQMFLVIKFWCEKNILSRQNFGHDKHTFVATKDVFVAKKRSSRQKWYLWQLPRVMFVNSNSTRIVVLLSTSSPFLGGRSDTRISLRATRSVRATRMVWSEACVIGIHEGGSVMVCI